MKEPDKPEEPKDQEENLPELEETSVSGDTSEPEFEEQIGEVLPPEKKIGNGCGFFLFILLIVTGGIVYLYFTDQIPQKIMEQIKPLVKRPEQELAKLKPQSTPRNSNVLSTTFAVLLLKSSYIIICTFSKLSRYPFTIL